MTDIIANLLALITRFVKENYKSSKFWISFAAVSLVAAWFFCSCTVSFQVAKKNGLQNDITSEQSTKVDSVNVSNSLNR